MSNKSKFLYLIAINDNLHSNFQVRVLVYVLFLDSKRNTVCGV